MTLSLINPANRPIAKPLPGSSLYLNVSEFFCDTIQGEGAYIGQPAAFLRLKGCTLQCWWCDTIEVWKKGGCYTFNQLFNLMEQADLPRKLYERQHLVITGGSPLIQQDRLILFFEHFQEIYGFKPFIEVENECVLYPKKGMLDMVNLWNNSPKLANSKILRPARYKPGILQVMGDLANSWFKFVITSNADWIEISHNYINKGLIKPDQVILMPEGSTRKEIEENREMVINLAIEHGVRYSTREQIILYNNQIGV
jgi:organic radical activating enzyme